MELKPTDAEFVRRARGGDRAAIEALIERHYEGVRSEGMRLLQSQERAEDLAQEAFLLATLHLGRLREDDRFGGWVRTIARNLARTWLRSDQRDSRRATRVNLEEAMLEQLPDGAPSAPEQMISQQDAAALMLALSQLPPDDRDLVTRHYLRHESQRTIAERLGVNHTTVSRRLDSALGRMRELMAPSATGAVRTKLLCGALVALPVASRAALAQKTAAEAARLCLPTWLNLHPTIAATAAGVLAMTTIQKSAAVLIAAAVIGFGGYQMMESAPAAPPARVVAITTGQESTIDLKAGESARLTFDTLSYPQNELSKYVTDYETIDFTAEADGSVTAKVVERTGETETVRLNGIKPDMTNIHVWQEMNLLLITTVVAEKTADGARVTMFRANRPELLPAAKALEARVEKGQISKSEYVTEAQALMEKNGMLPKSEAARNAIMRMVRE